MPIVPGTRESYIGVFLENIIYGVYLSVFVECFTLVANKKTRGIKHMYLVATTVIMFILITMRCVIDTFRCVAAFDGTDLDFGAPNSPLGILTNACWALVTPVADIFIVFRTYIVWGYDWRVVILPALLSLANLGTGALVIAALIEAGDQNSAISSSKVDSLNAFISLSLCTNVVCTGLIAFRIVQVHRQVSWMVASNTRRSSESLRVLSIIVESAAIYTLLLIATLITDHLDGFVSFILINCTPPTIGVVFSYIIIRVSRGTSYGENSITATSVSTLGARANTSTFGQSYTTRPGNRSEVQINLEQTTRGANDLQVDDTFAQEAAKMA
ncbi:hypothetical protein R3P38DRAFT_3376649 [Favolaschia claudopus]|uniref:Uncharacterized protein n=1 Tax=Favolaschia claudopus TaxID=2862362 RepID=A0AAV9ZF32_9AGAR